MPQDHPIDTEIYRDLHDALGDDKSLDKVLMREAAAEQLRAVLDGAPEWSIMSQLEPAGTESAAHNKQ